VAILGLPLRGDDRSGLDEFGQGSGKGLQSDGFAQMVIHPRGQASISIGLQGRRGQGDDGDPLAIGLGTPDRLRRFEPVHHRHLAIHQHRIVVTRGDRGDRGRSVADDVHLESQTPKHHRRNTLVDGIVLGQEHTALVSAVLHLEVGSGRGPLGCRATVG
jgi:hypothetical protein